MERQLTDSLSKLELASFDQVLGRYLLMDADSLNRRLRRLPISVSHPVPAGILAAISAVKRLDGEKCDERIVLIALLEAGLPVIWHALDRLRAVPEPILAFRTTEGFDAIASEKLPGIPLGDLTLLNRVALRMKGRASNPDCATKVAVIAGIAHSKIHFSDELNRWATEITCRFLAIGEDGI